MNHFREFRKISDEIRSSGGEYSAKILDEVAETFHSLLDTESFNPEKFLNEIWKNISNKGENNINRLKDEVIKRIGAGNMNLIPSEVPGVCHPFCLALASGTFGEKYYPTYGKIGFKGMMLKLVETWFTCLSTNEENLVLTIDWEQKTFNDLYKKVIDAYCRTHGKRVFVVLVSDSNIRLMYVS